MIVRFTSMVWLATSIIPFYITVFDVDWYGRMYHLPTRARRRMATTTRETDAITTISKQSRDDCMQQTVPSVKKT